ncbi:hypothetical protein [Caldalkalibacillus thermarum]|uniref:hypothetical protein n=1 Tax=Caldalkalibacillus thermarum TaxID=296745 RepID=UPI001665AC06|nr:hypothetical protein [Caldalkalibacillus thermarum]
MAQHTNQLLEGIGNMVRDVASAAETVSASSQQLLASTEETTKTIQSIARTNGEIAEGAEKTTAQMENSLNQMRALNQSSQNASANADQVKS